MANAIPNVGEVVFEINESNTTLTCEIKTKFGASAYGAFSSNRMGRDINTGRASVSALIEALENLKDHLDFHRKVEDWLDDNPGYLEEERDEDDYDFWEDCDDEPEPEPDEPVDFSKLGRVRPMHEIIQSIIDYNNSARVKNN